jgi:hypothetical protein
MHHFVATTQPLFASAFGGRALVTGLPGRVDLAIHRPGTLDRPGPEVPESAETSPYSVLVFENSDTDDNTDPLNTTFQDRNQPSRGAFDNDLVRLVLRRLPGFIGGEPPADVLLRLEFGGSGTRSIRLISPEGFPLEQGTLSAGQQEFRGQMALGLGDPLFERLRREEVVVFVEGLAPVIGARIRLQALNSEEQVITEDSVELSVIRGHMTSIWSEQYPASRSNLLPGNSGQSSFILMGNRADDRTYVGAHLEVEPNDPSVKDRLLVRLLTTRELRIFGESQRNGDDYSVVGAEERSDLTALNIEPQLIPAQYRTFLDPYLREVVVAGLDQNADGDLSTDEVNVTYQVPIWGGGPVFTTVTNPGFQEVRGIQEPHFKVVSRSVYTSQAITPLVGVILIEWGAEILQFLAEHLPDPPINFTGSLPMGVRHLLAFLQGSMPTDPEAPSQVGSYQLPDSIRHQPGQSSADQHVGPFGSDGYQTIPRYIYDPTSAASREVLNSTGFENVLRDIAGEFEFIQLARTAASSDPDPANGFHFNVIVDQAHGFPVFGGGFAPRNELDLFLGIGGFVARSLTLQVAGTALGSPYIPNQTEIRIDGFQVDGRIQDLYDWDLGVNPFNALTSAGHNTLGTAGRMFQVEILVRGARSVEGLVIK